MRSSCFAAALVSLMGAGAAASCSSFSEDQPAGGDDAGVDAPVVGEGGGLEAGAEDGGALPDGGERSSACPPPPGGSALPTAWNKRSLFEPSGPAERMYPFAIATDRLHVTWVAQLGEPDGGVDTAPYNGNGNAVVMRAPKLGVGMPAIVARDQPGATTVALDGLQVYWTTWQKSEATLLQQRRDVDCKIDCPAPEIVVTFPSGERIARLVSVAPKVLFALSQSGKVYRIGLGTVPAQVLESGTFPAITATSTHVFASAGLKGFVGRVQVDGGASDPSYLAVPPVPDAGVGVSPIATDCTSLWMTRAMPDGRHVAGHDLSVPGSFQDLVLLGPAVDVFDMAADAKYVYVAAANAGGVFAVDKSSKGIVRPYAGNVFALAVDEDGVYFGEHAAGPTAGGMFMLVKK